MIMIWLACLWIIWKERNNIIFNNNTSSIIQLLDNDFLEKLLDGVKLFFCWWPKAKFTHIVFGYHDWWRNPLMYLDIG